MKEDYGQYRNCSKAVDFFSMFDFILVQLLRFHYIVKLFTFEGETSSLSQ